MITVFSTAPVISVKCRLSAPISSDITVQWLHNSSLIMNPDSVITGDTVILQLRDLESTPDIAGVYRCMFTNHYVKWTLERSITLHSKNESVELCGQ